MKKTRGFTLVELIIYMGIFSIFLLVLTSMFTSILDSQFETNSITSVEQDGRFILRRLTNDIQSSSSINVPSAIGASSNSLQLVINGITNTYTLTNGNLTLTNDKGTNNLNNYDTTISNLSFTRLGNTGGKNTVTVSFKSTSKTLKTSGPEIKNFNMTIGTR